MRAVDKSPDEVAAEPGTAPHEAPATPNEILIPAALSPADAAELRDRLVEALETAGPSGIALELDGGAPMPCALQLIVAAKRSAEAIGLPCVLGPAADSARATLTLDQPQE